MAKLEVITREGETLEIEAELDSSLMENIREAGIDELLAICGGCQSCATCHVYVAADFLPLLPQPTDDESFLLESTGIRQANSRLSCQVVMTPELDGLSLTIAPEA